MTEQELIEQCPIIFERFNTKNKQAMQKQAEFFKTHTFILDTLNKKEAEILKLRYGIIDDKIRILKTISNHLGCSIESVREIEKTIYINTKRGINTHGNDQNQIP